MCVKIMKGVMGAKTVNIPAETMQSKKRSLHLRPCGQIGNKHVPGGFRHSEQVSGFSVALGQIKRTLETAHISRFGLVSSSKKKIHTHTPPCAFVPRSLAVNCIFLVSVSMNSRDKPGRRG